MTKQVEHKMVCTSTRTFKQKIK